MLPDPSSQPIVTTRRAQHVTKESKLMFPNILQQHCILQQEQEMQPIWGFLEAHLAEKLSTFCTREWLLEALLCGQRYLEHQGARLQRP